MSEVFLGPPCRIENLLESATRECVPTVMVMHHDPATIRMSIDSLTPFGPAIDKSILFQSSDEPPDRNIPEAFVHTVMATAGRSITSMVPTSNGRASPASIMSWT